MITKTILILFLLQLLLLLPTNATKLKLNSIQSYRAERQLKKVIDRMTRLCPLSMEIRLQAAYEPVHSLLDHDQFLPLNEQTGGFTIDCLMVVNEFCKYQQQLFILKLEVVDALFNQRLSLLNSCAVGLKINGELLDQETIKIVWWKLGELMTTTGDDSQIKMIQLQNIDMTAVGSRALTGAVVEYLCFDNVSGLGHDFFLSNDIVLTWLKAIYILNSQISQHTRDQIKSTVESVNADCLLIID